MNSPLDLSLTKNLTYKNWFEFIDSPTNIEVIGQLIYTHQVFYFLLCGLVLLVAMIGAIVLTSQSRDKSVRVQEVFHQLSRNSKNAIFLTSIEKNGK